MTSTASSIGIGTTVSYEDMANPLRKGKIVGEAFDQWLVLWDDPAEGVETMTQDEVAFHTSVTKTMLARAVERQHTSREERRGRLGGWEAITRPCVFCGSEVTSSNPETDFCRNCFYSGEGLRRSLSSPERGNLIGAIGDIDEVVSVDVQHTGGGCFNLAVRLANGLFVTPSAGFRETTGEHQGTVFAEPGIPSPDDEGEALWGIVVSEWQTLHRRRLAEQEATAQESGRCPECGGPLEGWAGEHHSIQCSQAESAEESRPTSDELEQPKAEEAWEEWDEERLYIPQTLYTDSELVAAIQRIANGKEQ